MSLLTRFREHATATDFNERSSHAERVENGTKYMGMMDGLLESLGESPAVQEALAVLKGSAQGFANAMVHFNNRLDGIEAKQDKIIILLEQRSNTLPAGDDGLMKLLAENGEDMVIISNLAEPIQREPPKVNGPFVMSVEDLHRMRVENPLDDQGKRKVG